MASIGGIGNKTSTPSISSPSNTAPTQTTKSTEPTKTTSVQTGHDKKNSYESVTPGKVGSGFSVMGAPLSTATKGAKESARLTRAFANTARSNMVKTFAEGGELALKNTGAAKAAMNLESSALRTASLASKLDKTGKALGVAGGVLTAVDQGLNSSAQTTAGKVISGTIAGGTGYAFGASHPYLAAGDAIAGLAGAPDTPSNVFNKSVDTLVTVSEAAITGDTKGLDTLHERNLSGENGVVFQTAGGIGEQFAAITDAVATGDVGALDRLHQNNLNGDNGALMKMSAEAGDYWAEHGIVGGLSNFWDAIW